ncbi:MAG TPA: hypothetical protein VF796_27605 [Humisphaera sp.]
MTMKFTTENGGDLGDLTAEAMDGILAEEGFGGFAILGPAEDVFIQAADTWEPGDETSAFRESHGSDPWVLEYREAGRQYQAHGHVTLDQVREAFRSYLAGDGRWRAAFQWHEIEV